MLSASRLVLVLSTAIAVGGCGVSSGPRRFLFGDMETGADVDGDVTFGDVDLGARGASPNDPNNAMKDSDCDGLSDEEEFSIVWSGGNRTDPTNADTDNDGLLDGLEVGHTVSVDPDCQGFVGDSEPLSTTIPTEADSDADTLPDGIEDVSGNGKVDPFELDPNNPDCDGDGLVDGLEDKSHDGKRDPNETDPLKWDSDGDRIGDGSELKITRTDPLLVDTDKDGCWDGNEDYNQDGMVQMGETDPHNGNDCGVQNAVDIDKDGIPDAIEDANHNGKWDPGETDVNNPDTDGDKLKDGVEDKNRDGRVGLGETDPRWVDSDCDGLIDGPDQGKVLGEDQNTNGMVDKGETDPSSIDSDGDGLSDGMERGIAVNPDPNHCPNFIADADPNTTSDPLNADSDGDGVADGAEDADQNGRVDPGELDPKDPNDGQGPVAKACAKNNLKMVTFKQEGQADLQLALPTTFAEVATMKVNGAARGLIGYDAANKVAFLVYRGPAPGGGQNPTADEVTLRASVAGQGAISNPTTQTFNTWDGYQALQAFYDQAGGNDVKTQTNALANALAGNGAGALMGMGGGAGPFRLQVEIVHRSQNSVVVLIALTPIANLVEPAIFSVRDVGSGSALAQFGDANNVQCEPFKPKGGAVDFIFVVDNSGSMGSYQAALGATAMATANALNNAAVDWRIAVVTTDYDRSPVLRGFTRNINDFNGWMTQGGNNWVGISGSGLENCLSSAARAVSDLTPAPGNEVANKVRTGASIAVVILGDADDQSANSAPQYVNFFNNPNAVVGGYTNKSGGKITVHGIICPMGQKLRRDAEQPAAPRRRHRRHRRRARRHHRQRVDPGHHERHRAVGHRRRRLPHAQAAHRRLHQGGDGRGAEHGRLQRRRHPAQPRQRLRLRRREPHHLVLRRLPPDHELDEGGRLVPLLDRQHRQARRHAAPLLQGPVLRPQRGRLVQGQAAVQPGPRPV